MLPQQFDHALIVLQARDDAILISHQSEITPPQSNMPLTDT